MLEKEINWVQKIINCFYQGYFSNAQGEIETLKNFIPHLFNEYIEKYRSDKAKIAEIRTRLKRINSALAKARHYALRAGRDNNPEVINHLKVEGMKYCKETMELLQELDSHF